MRVFRGLALGASMLVLLGACSTGGGSGTSPGTSAGSGATIKIGSDGFDEARVMAEVYAQALEAQGFTVDRAGIGLGARAVTTPALESGQIDLKPEYLGGGLAFYDATKVTQDSDTNWNNLKAALEPKGISVLAYTPGQDTNAFVVKKETADQYGTKLSDYTDVQDELKWGLATDCPTNPVCAAALESEYGLAPEDVTLIDACSTPMAEALKQGTIDVAELCSTSPEIIVEGWVRLEDDKGTQPAENVAPVVRNDLLAKLDRAKFEKTLNDVSAKVDTPTLADLYKQVSIDKKDLAVVAKAWLQSQGFVQ
jgi:osmoprotectant transport system substrate-binding protein